MLIGADEVAAATDDLRNIKETYGEFSGCIIRNDSIQLFADYFGMVPWFYFDNDDVFAASNNYHLLLLMLTELGVKLSMNIRRSRVNIITSGFTYGSPFSVDLDVNGCRINLAYEEVHYSSVMGVSLPRTSLWDILSDKNEWNAKMYEECIYKAKDEIISNCKAAFEQPRFKKIVVDVSGGFDSRIVFAAAAGLPKKLRAKLYTYTKETQTVDDIEKASAITNIYNFPKHSYDLTDTSELFDDKEQINLAQVSRTLGVFSCYPQRFTAAYNDRETLEITGYLGEVTLGYMRCRGEIEYSLGDKRLLARLGGCYLHNSVDELQEVFRDQERLIFNTLENYHHCDCLFKKFQQLYIDFRNRFMCGSAHNIENNNLRIPMLFSKYALKAKWLYFNKFHDNNVPDEKVSLDILMAIEPLLAALPFAKGHHKMPEPEVLLTPYRLEVAPDFTIHSSPEPFIAENLYRDKAIEYMDSIDTAEQMLLHIYDYSEEYQSVCLGLYKVLQLFREQPEDALSGHGRETLKNIYDVYYQIRLVEGTFTID